MQMKLLSRLSVLLGLILALCTAPVFAQKKPDASAKKPVVVKAHTRVTKSGKVVHVKAHVRKAAATKKVAVKGYTRTTKSGKVVHVKGHTRTVPAAKKK